ncbi:MAG TPA: amidohydrolase family protein [Polyangiaceae bacterium LLY-WYZ-15_(1-7)]|nr:imidazolonepropionase [Sandaracinus sp.]HJL01269.1 amidohydrolase family protein [Polyangiaceae bacterium LLY-WYZ-15_(1-7)]MBJ70278.1 imidazolonepropionase [Sandaracinus sp.]HJL12920.1 amidohydrolase family protein [Polyangiaceae bacterium LLY-WYZ-15_(1-7)]HJL26383.1 amidohydrolase family protein [Polyangiaceae bacterium LLY-WYZ-15_(1-7)]
MSRRLRVAASLLGATLLAAAPASAQDVVALTGITLHPGDGDPVENATVVIRDGRIVAAGADVRAPAGASVVTVPNGAGVVTPGLVAVGAPLGLREIDLEEATRDDAPEEEDADPIRAAFSAADGYDPASTLVRVARLGGLTSALVTPTGGLVPGTSALVDLGGETPAQAIVARDVALHVDLHDGGVDAAGGAMPMALTRLREVLEDARLYGRQRAAYDRRGVRELAVSRLDLERLQPALRGEIPVVVRVGRAADILRVLELGEEYGLDLVLAGVEEGWRVRERLAEAEVPVIVQPLTNLPRTFTTRGSRYDNATLLADAGVPLILATSGAHDLRNLRQEAGNAVRFGLDPAAALRAITVTPASVFGDGSRGVIAPGKIANLVLWSGDPFELSSRPLRIFVRGVDVPLRSRQTALFQRYRDLENVRRGFPGREILPGEGDPGELEGEAPEAEVAPDPAAREEAAGEGSDGEAPGDAPPADEAPTEAEPAEAEPAPESGEEGAS